MTHAAASPWVLVLAVSACAASGPTTISSDHPLESPGDSSPATPDAGNQPAPTRWQRFDEVRSWQAARDEPYVSRGHPPGYFLATVRVTPEALESYRSLTAGTEFAEGTVIAQFQEDPEKGVPGPVFVMTRIRPESWEFMVVDPDGWIHDRGQIPLCARCHAEAVADGLFGMPRAAARDAGID